MTTNEGVGKKIVEALKKQSGSEFEISEVSEIEEKEVSIDEIFSDSALKEETILTETSSNYDYSDEKFEITESSEDVNDVVAGQKEFVFSESSIQQTPQPYVQQSSWNFETAKADFQEPSNYEQTSAKQFAMPANVAVLKKLITQLPTGVTRQTGAQIIKQTMEALGISMNSVLHDAQKVQDEMNSSIKNCMMTIQEYKNNIKNLEKQGLDYQRQVNQLNDLISLFILSDKD